MLSKKMTSLVEKSSGYKPKPKAYKPRVAVVVKWSWDTCRLGSFINELLNNKLTQ